MNKLDLKEIKAVFKKMVESLQKTAYEINIFFNERNKVNKKLGTDDSMQLSYFETSVL